MVLTANAARTDITRVHPSNWVLILVCAAQLLLQLDFSIVNVALPAMADDLGFSSAGLQWVVTGYALAFGSLLLLGGRVGDLFGHRRVLVIGLFAFALSSLTGGLAIDAATLVISRIAQGLSAALIAPAALAILTATFTAPEDRTRALTVFQASVAGGASAGVVLGGFLVEYPGWRWVLLVNPPIIVLLIVLILWRIGDVRPVGERRRLDVTGALLVTGSISALVFGMSEGQTQGFASPVAVGAIILSVVLISSFIVAERRMTDPMLPLGLVRDGKRAVSLVVLFLLGGVLTSYVYFMSLYLQQVLDFSAIATGLALVPATLTVMLASFFVSRRLIGRMGTRWTLLLAMPVLAIGQVWLSFISADGTYPVDVLPGVLLSAFGVGLAFPALSVAITAGVAPKDRGVAGGLLVTSQQVGSAVGLALLATIAAERSDAMGGAIVDGYRIAFLVSAGIALAATALTMSLPRTGRPSIEASPS